MFRCNECGRSFEDYEVGHRMVCWESYYGVSSSFMSSHYDDIDICPYCGSSDIEEFDEEDWNEE